MPDSVNLEQVATGAVFIAIGFATENPGMVLTGGGLVMAGLNPQEVEEIEASESIDARTVSFRSSKPPRQIVYGETLVSGPIVYTTTQGVKNEWLWQVMMIATHEVASIGALYLDGNLAIDGDGTVQPDYSGFVQLYKHTVGATVDTNLQAASRPQWLGSNNGLKFNGASQFADVDANTRYSTAAITIELEVKPFSSGPAVLWGRADDWELILNADRTVTFTDSLGVSVTSSEAVEDKVFTHIAIVADGSDIEIFQNGVSKGTAGSGYTGAGGSKKLYWASRIGASHFFHGQLTEGRIWNDKRTAQELIDNRATNLTGGEAGLIGLWEFADGSGTTITDDGGSSDDGTLRPVWLDTATLDGLAYAVVATKLSEGHPYQGGAPVIALHVRGKKVEDPRESPTLTEFSNNPALIARDFCLLPDYGPRMTAAFLPEAPNNTAATVCDEDVAVTAEPETFTADAIASPTTNRVTKATDEPWARGDRVGVASNGSPEDLPSGLSSGTPYYWIPISGIDTAGQLAASVGDAMAGTAVAIADQGTGTHTVTRTHERRYQFDGVLYVTGAPGRNLRDILKTMAGDPVRYGGTLRFLAGAFVAPASPVADVTLTLDDINDGFVIDELAGTGKTFNAAKGVFKDPRSKWKANDYPVVVRSNYETEDGQRHYLEISFPNTRSVTAAQRLATIAIERHRRQRVINELPVRVANFDIVPGDTIALNLDVMDYVGKTFRVTQVQHMAMIKGAGRVIDMRIRLQEWDAGIYTWSTGDEGTFTRRVGSGLPNPFIVEAPGSVAASFGNQSLDGDTLQVLTVTWTAPNDDLIQATGNIEIRYKLEADSIYRLAGSVKGDVVSFVTTEIVLPGTYDIEVRAVNSILSVSPWVATTTLKQPVPSYLNWTGGRTIGNSFNILNISSPALAALTATRIALFDDNANTLTAYDFDGTSWSKTGNSLSLSAIQPSLAALGTARVALIDATNAELRTYDFDGTDWTLTGNGLSITVGVSSMAALSATRVAVYELGDDELRAYDFDGTDWTLTGNELGIAAAAAPVMATLSSSRIAFYDVGNRDLRAYDFDGTDWTQTGNDLNITAPAAAALVALNQTDVVLANATDDLLQIYRFDGTDWVQDGFDQDAELAGMGEPGMAALNGTDIVIIDANNHDLQSFRFDFQYASAHSTAAGAF